jgi:galactose mutarotase-like enzyme
LREKLLESGPLYGAVVWNTAENYQVYYYFERPFKNLVIWNKTGEDGFICIEPQTCAVNAFNIDKPDSITGRFALDGGAVFRAATTMGLVELDAKNRPGEVK